MDIIKSSYITVKQRNNNNDKVEQSLYSDKSRSMFEE